MDQQKVIAILHHLGIQELQNVNQLLVLEGSYINLKFQLPNGKMAQILDDDKTYWGCQVEKINRARCYGVASDESMLAVYEYGCDGQDAVLRAWIRY